MLKELLNLAALLKELYDGCIGPGYLLVAVILAGVVHAAAVKYESAAVAAVVVGQALAV